MIIIHSIVLIKACTFWNLTQGFKVIFFCHSLNIFYIVCFIVIPAKNAYISNKYGISILLK